MSEDLSFGDWNDVTPEAMKGYSEAKLHLAIVLAAGGRYDWWARAELARRQNVQLGELISNLEKATS